MGIYIYHSLSTFSHPWCSLFHIIYTLKQNLHFLCFLLLLELPINNTGYSVCFITKGLVGFQEYNNNYLSRKNMQRSTDFSLWMKSCDMTMHSTKSYWAVLSCCTVYYAVQGGSNFWVCRRNPEMWPFKWKPLSSSFLSCCFLYCTRWL